MSLTEPSRVDDLARSLFDDVILSSFISREASGQGEYFPLAPDPVLASYFEPVESDPIGRAALSDYPGGGRIEGMIEALAVSWVQTGDTELADMAPRLRAIAEALRVERGPDSGDVDIYCYTMF